MAVQRRRQKAVFRPDQELYQARTVDEDRQRTNSHYEQPVEFFLTLTGGDWNAYSANLWDAHITTVTESQEAKLDLLAEAMQLKPGQRIMDVDCGWGGPLVYLCKKYGVRGVGLTLSALQKHAAEERVARHGVDVEIVLSHWADFQDARGFDAVYTDEAIVHFYHLGEFFWRVNSVDTAPRRCRPSWACSALAGYGVMAEVESRYFLRAKHVLHWCSTAVLW